MNQTILEEAQEITDGARQSDYGDARESFNLISEIANTLQVDVSAKDVCKVLISLKLAREINSHKRDNLVDACGYIRLLSILEGDED